MQSDLSSPSAPADASEGREVFAARAVTALSGVLAVGCLLLALAHTGIDIPGVSALGPAGNRAVVPAAIAFSVATVAVGAVTVGAARRRSWAWALGLVVHALILLGAAMPIRGAGSIVAIVVSAAALALLVSRPGRAAFLPAPG